MMIDQSTPSKQDYYLAAIAAETRRSWVSDPKKVDLKPFLLEFKPVKDPDARPRKKSKEQQSQMANSKMFWMALTKLPKVVGKKKRGKSE